MDDWPVATETGGPRVRVLLAVGLCAAIAIWFVALDPFAPGAAAQEAAVRSAILTDMTIVALPSNASPGHIDAVTLAALHRRIDEVLPSVFTGSLLDLKRDRLSTYLDAVAASEGQGANREAGIDGLTIRTRQVSGTHAAVTGTYSAWLTGEHWDNGRLTTDRVSSTYSFSAGLDLVGGRWLVSSWADQQLD